MENQNNYEMTIPVFLPSNDFLIEPLFWRFIALAYTHLHKQIWLLPKSKDENPK